MDVLKLGWERVNSVMYNIEVTRVTVRYSMDIIIDYE